MVRAGLLLPQQATPAGAGCLELCHVSCQASKPVIKGLRDLPNKSHALAQARRRPRSNSARTPRCAPGCPRTVTCTGRAQPADARAAGAVLVHIVGERGRPHRLGVQGARSRPARSGASAAESAPSAADSSAARLRAGAQVQDTPGYGDNCSILSNIAEMVAYVERQNAAVLRVEQDARRAVDLCGPAPPRGGPSPAARGRARRLVGAPCPAASIGLTTGRPRPGPTSKTRAWTCASSACPRTACAPLT